MRALLTGVVVLILLLYIDWKFIRGIFNRASSAGLMDPEVKLKRMIVDVVTKNIYVPEAEEFVCSREFQELLENYKGQELDELLEEEIEEAYRSFLRERGEG